MRIVNKFIPPYLTFTTFLEGMSTIQGKNDIVTKESLQDKAKNINKYDAPRVLNALKKFHIIDDEGKVVLEDDISLPLKENDMKQVIYRVIFKYYSELLSVDKDDEGKIHITNDAATKFMNDHGLNDSTAKRGVDFFVRACEYAKIPINFNSVLRRKHRILISPHSCVYKISGPDKNDNSATKNNELNKQYNSHRIELGLGEYIDVVMHVNLFNLAKGKREKIFDAIDVLKELEKSNDNIE